MKLVKGEDYKGRKLMLIALPPHHAKELREANNKVPTPGDKGVCTDFELYDPELKIVEQDYIICTFDDGNANGQATCLPAYCFRDVTNAEQPT